MSAFIPKEQQTAYQRWELASFEQDAPRRPARPVAESAADGASRLAAQHRQAAEEAQRAAYAAGFEEGRAAGFAQGQDAGFEQGRAEGLASARAQAEQERAQLQQIAHAFGAEVAQASERIAGDVLHLALDLAHAMLKNALAVRPEVVIPVVVEAIRYLPTVQQPARLTLHPEDALIVHAQMGPELEKAGWRVTEDAGIARGGCRVETATNQIDATAPTRWQRISAALGKESEWLA
jgi:flagellar assembly protein FliH